MKIRVLIAAGSGAALGAIIWALISYNTGYEVGYVAWGIGLLVGFGGSLAGGRGPAAGVVCAALALASIFVGKMLTVQYVIKHELESVAEVGLTHDLYDETALDAADFAKITSEEDYPEFMVSHAFSEYDAPADVTDEEIADFKEYSVDNLREFHEDQPTFDEWRERQMYRMRSMALSHGTTSQVVLQSLGLFDVIFAILGLVTAYRIASGGEEGAVAAD